MYGLRILDVLDPNCAPDFLAVFNYKIKINEPCLQVFHKEEMKDATSDLH